MSQESWFLTVSALEFPIALAIILLYLSKVLWRTLSDISEASKHQPGDQQTRWGNPTQASSVQVSAPKNSLLILTSYKRNHYLSLITLHQKLQNLLWNFLLSSAHYRHKFFKGIRPRAIPYPYLSISNLIVLWIYQLMYCPTFSTTLTVCFKMSLRWIIIYSIIH